MTTAENETIDFGEVGKKPRGSIFMPMLKLGIHPRVGNQTRIYLIRNEEPCDRITSAWSNKAFVIMMRIASSVNYEGFVSSKTLLSVYQIDLNRPPTVINRAK
uniref:Uncharacterized protein n=1 Tax=Ditylenchus dipsaci TaxID=166011 RepID=A0A915DHG9_9BILA